MDVISLFLLLLYTLLRSLKSILIVHFFNKPLCNQPALADLPSFSLLQPISHSVRHLREHLLSRIGQDYPLSHFWICDEADKISLQICRELSDEFPEKDIRLIILPGSEKIQTSSKIHKIQVALPFVATEIIGFIDDDIELLPGSLLRLVQGLEAGVGAAFGLPAAVSWGNTWSAAMSTFVNAQALPHYVPLTYFLEPYTITGHLYALRKTDFDRAGGFDNMENRLDDDHELARRLHAINLKIRQLPLVYKVSNEFGNFRDFFRQLKRWFVFPRQMMSPFLTDRQKILSLLLDLDILLPAFLSLLLLVRPNRFNLLCVTLTAIVSLLGFGLNLFYLKTFSWKAWFWLLPVTFLLPFYLVWVYVLGGKEIVWRGQRLRIHKGGEFEVLNSESA
jgi:ceramide glucosyltransferase